VKKIEIPPKVTLKTKTHGISSLRWNSSDLAIVDLCLTIWVPTYLEMISVTSVLQLPAFSTSEKSRNTLKTTPVYKSLRRNWRWALGERI
jgi:hypothetical protein